MNKDVNYPSESVSLFFQISDRTAHPCRWSWRSCLMTPDGQLRLWQCSYVTSVYSRTTHEPRSEVATVKLPLGEVWRLRNVFFRLWTTAVIKTANPERSLNNHSFSEPSQRPLSGPAVLTWTKRLRYNEQSESCPVDASQWPPQNVQKCWRDGNILLCRENC